MRTDELKNDLKQGVRDYARTELRWSYLIVGFLSLAGVVVNFFLPHGWVVWPAVVAIGIIIMINEAATRNGQGVPPLVVYGWFFAALALWAAMAVIFSALFPVLMMVGVPLMAGYGIYAYLKNRKMRAAMEERRAKGLCIHCAQPVGDGAATCQHCGRDVAASDMSFLKRFQKPDRTAEDIAKTRDLLTPKPPTVAAKRKEEALLAARARASSSKPQTPPRA